MNRLIGHRLNSTIFFILLAIVFTFSDGHAQSSDYSDIKRNGIYLEAYLVQHDFSDGFVSVNYERALGKKRRANIRVGIYPDFESSVAFPVTLSWITKPLKPHHLEYGVGAVFRVEHYVDPLGLNTRECFYDIPAIMFPLMYRYQRNSGLFVRAGINLLVSWPTIPAPAMSLGYRF